MTNAREIKAPLTHPLDGLALRRERKRSDGRVQHLMEYLTSKVGDLDGTALDNRRACWSLILKAEKAQPDGDAVKSIMTLIDIATAPECWHSKNVTNFRYLLNHARKIANEHRERIARPQGWGGAVDLDTKRRMVLEAVAHHQHHHAGAGYGGHGVPDPPPHP